MTHHHRKRSRKRYLSLRIALSAAGPVAAMAAASGPSTQVVLDVSLRQSALSVKIKAPLGVLVGFDRRPQNANEQAEIDKAIAKLKSPTLLFEIPAAAGCSLNFDSLESEVAERRVLEPAASSTLQTPPPTAGTLAAQGTGGHMVAAFSGTCSKTAQFDHLSSSWFQLFPLTQGLEARVDRDGRAGSTTKIKPAPTIKIPVVSAGTLPPRPPKK